MIMIPALDSPGAKPFISLRSLLVVLALTILQLSAYSQSNTVTGRVVGPDNQPLELVSVTATGTTKGTTTNKAGMYSLSVPAGTKTLDFSLVGYTNATLSVSGRSVLSLTLELSGKALEDVTVTGYTSYSRARSANAATTVTADKINQVPLTLDQALQGRVPGLVVAAASGQPGQNAKVTLRGVNTITGNSAVLYVMDGIPIENGYLQNINPSDIETVTVLKDASAKALYGSRGSNGVIVITSKKGKAGKVSFNYNSQYGFSTPSSPRFQMMSGAEHLQFEEEIGLETNAPAGPGWTYSKKNPVYATKTAAEQQRYDFILDSLSKINTDWRKFFFRTGKFMEQQISASGGNDNVRFYSSLNYYNQDGIAVRSKMQRMTLKNNVDFTADKFVANINLTLGYSSSSFIEAEGGSSGNNPLSAVYYALGYEYPYFPNDSLVHSGNTNRFPVLDSREGSNAYERMLNTSNKSNQLKGILATSLAYTIANGLVAKTRLGIDFRQSIDEAYVNPDSYSGSRVTTGRKGSYSEASRRNFSFIATSGLAYNKLIADKHDIELQGLFEYTGSRYSAFGFTGYGIEGRLPETPAGVIVGATTIPAISGSKSSTGLASYIALGRYTFNNKYTLNVSYRYDGSSTVPEKNRWHGFYSAGLSWDAKKENFLADINVISALRVRTSYGTTASPFARDFGYTATFAATTYGGLQGIRPTAPGNTEYDWEYTKEFNAGFDLQLFKSRVRIIADVYKKNTSNLFFNRPLSITSGFSSILLNAGSVENKGIETDLQVDIIRNKDLTWTLGGNISFNKNEVTDLGGAPPFEIGINSLVAVGKPLGTHYAPKWAGVDPATGNPQYYTPAGDITTSYNAVTLSVSEFGSSNPSTTGSISTSIQWKGFTAAALLVFVADVYRYNNEDYYNENPSFRTSNQSTRMLYNRWKKPGDNAILPKITSTRYYTSRDIYDASYTRLRNVNIGYNIPVTLFSRLKNVRGIRVFIQGENLLTWTDWRGFDPENGNEYNRFSYPSPRTYTAGLNVNF